MLSNLLENLLTDPTLRPVNVTQIRPTEELRVYLFNDDQLNNHRIQIIDAVDSFKQLGLPENEFQNPTAHLGEAGTPDGLYACLSNTPKTAITCAGGTSSAYVEFDETDLFDITINNASYVNQTFAQVKALLEAQQVEIVTMVNAEEPVPPVEVPLNVVTVAPNSVTYVVYAYNANADTGEVNHIKLFRTMDNVQTEFVNPFVTMLTTPIEGFDFKIDEPSAAYDLAPVLNIPIEQANEDEWNVYRYPVYNSSSKEVKLELISLDENVHRFAFI